MPSTSGEISNSSCTHVYTPTVAVALNPPNETVSSYFAPVTADPSA